MLPKVKNCPDCGEEMLYNNHYHMFECECGETWNYGLQRLAPLSQWQEEYDSEDDY